MEIGSRVSDAENYYGTVRYRGPVAASKVKTDEWIGIEWDDSTRGKHDGSCLGESGVFHRYFDCAFGAGSFVKEHKLIQGKGFVDALYERYKDTSSTGVASDEHFAMTAKGHQKPIEFVGENNIRKWQRLDLLKQVTLPKVGIAIAGDKIHEIAGHFTYADIQYNLIHSWYEVAKIASQIPSLQSYYILGNKMEMVTPDIIARIPSNWFAHLKIFCISKCKIHSWDAVQILNPLLTNIEELFMTHSNFEDMPLYDSIDDSLFTVGFNSLKKLDVSSCQISDWAQILSFGKLPALTELLADDNPITKIIPLPAGLFPVLSRFSLTAISIEDWSDIDAFGSYPTLQNLRLTDVAFLVSKGISESRSITIARIGHLTFLNGSPITAKERNNAETTYVRRCIRDFDDGNDHATDRIIASGQHPRFSELYQRYSAELVTLSKARAGNTIQSDALEVILKNLSFISNGSLEPVSKKLPASLQVARLRQLVKQLFGLEPVLQQLSFRVYKDALPVVMDDDDMTLAQYGVINGAEIFINEAKA